MSRALSDSKAKPNSFLYQFEAEAHKKVQAKPSSVPAAPSEPVAEPSFFRRTLNRLSGRKSSEKIQEIGGDANTTSTKPPKMGLLKRLLGGKSAPASATSTSSDVSPFTSEPGKKTAALPQGRELLPLKAGSPNGTSVSTSSKNPLTDRFSSSNVSLTGSSSQFTSKSRAPLPESNREQSDNLNRTSSLPRPKSGAAIPTQQHPVTRTAPPQTDDADLYSSDSDTEPPPRQPVASSDRNVSSSGLLPGSTVESNAAGDRRAIRNGTDAPSGSEKSQLIATNRIYNTLPPSSSLVAFQSSALGRPSSRSAAPPAPTDSSASRRLSSTQPSLSSQPSRGISSDKPASNSARSVDSSVDAAPTDRNSSRSSSRSAQPAATRSNTVLEKPISSSEQTAVPLRTTSMAEQKKPPAAPVGAVSRATLTRKPSAQNESDDESEESSEDETSSKALRARELARRTQQRKDEAVASSSQKSSESRKAGQQDHRETESKSDRRGTVRLFSMPSKLSDNRIRAVVGLQNLGNTCFMNACLQCLCSTPPLIEYFISHQYRNHVNPQSRIGGKLAFAFADLITRVRSGDSGDVLQPSDVKRTVSIIAPRFSGYGQNDVQEFLQFLLDGLHDDLNKVRVKPKYEEIKDKDTDKDEVKSDRWWKNYTDRNNSFISDLFCGQLKSTVECQSCHHCSTAFDPFWDLSVPIPKRKTALFSRGNCSLHDCFEAFTEKELLTGNEQYYCSRCKTHRDSVKSLTIFRFPHILVVTLKRFSSNQGRFFSRQKLETFIDFPVKDLDLTDFSPNLKYANRGERAVYDLFAVANHMGGLGGGHYTAYAKVGEDEWYCFNDSRASLIKQSQIQGSEAYLLFYMRRNS